MVTEALTSRSYSKIFSPFFMVSYISSPEELRKKLVETFCLTKKLIENQEIRIMLKKILTEFSLKILHKSLHLQQFECIDVILKELNTINKIE
jgi:hypothetical protein